MTTMKIVYNAHLLIAHKKEKNVSSKEENVPSREEVTNRIIVAEN